MSIVLVTFWHNIAYVVSSFVVSSDFTWNLVQNLMSLALISRRNRKWSKMAKTKIALKNVYMPCSGVYGLKDWSRLRGYPQNWVLSSYCDSTVPPNGKRSTIKSFPKVSLILLTLPARIVFKKFWKNEGNCAVLACCATAN